MSEMRVYDLTDAYTTKKDGENKFEWRKFGRDLGIVGVVMAAIMGLSKLGVIGPKQDKERLPIRPRDTIEALTNPDAYHPDYRILSYGPS